MNDEVTYRASSYCPEGQCIEAAPLPDGSISLRDSKDLTKEPHIFSRKEWDAFVLGVKDGEFDFSTRPAPALADCPA